MPKPIRCEVEIQRRPQEVFDYLAACENEPKWNEDVPDCTLLSGDSGTVGARYSRTQKAMGQELTTTMELTEVEPGRRFAFRSKGGPATVTGAYEVEPVGDGARVVTTLEAGMMTSFMRPLITPRLNVALAELKRLLEAS